MTSISDLSISQSQANSPGEDRYTIRITPSIQAFGVMDGHGGYLACDLAITLLLDMIIDDIESDDDNKLSNHRCDDPMCSSSPTLFAHLLLISHCFSVALRRSLTQPFPNVTIELCKKHSNCTVTCNLLPVQDQFYHLVKTWDVPEPVLCLLSLLEG